MQSAKAKPKVEPESRHSVIFIVWIINAIPGQQKNTCQLHVPVVLLSFARRVGSNKWCSPLNVLPDLDVNTWKWMLTYWSLVSYSSFGVKPKCFQKTEKNKGIGLAVPIITMSLKACVPSHVKNLMSERHWSFGVKMVFLFMKHLWRALEWNFNHLFHFSLHVSLWIASRTCSCFWSSILSRWGTHPICRRIKCILSSFMPVKCTVSTILALICLSTVWNWTVRMHPPDHICCSLSIHWKVCYAFTSSITEHDVWYKTIVRWLNITVIGLFLYSFWRVREDMDVASSTLIGAHGYCTQVSLFLCVCFVIQVFQCNQHN